MNVKLPIQLVGGKVVILEVVPDEKGKFDVNHVKNFEAAKVIVKNKLEYVAQVRIPDRGFNVYLDDILVKMGFRRRLDDTCYLEEEKCRTLAYVAETDYVSYCALHDLIVALMGRGIELPISFQAFISGVLTGIIKRPPKPSRPPDYYRHYMIQHIVLLLHKAKFHPISRNEAYSNKRCLFDVIIEANEETKAFDFLTFNSVKASYNMKIFW